MFNEAINQDPTVYAIPVFIALIAIEIFLKMFLENLGKYLHLLKLFLVILAFNTIIGIFFLYKFKIILGQISESTKIDIDGFQYFINFDEK